MLAVSWELPTGAPIYGLSIRPGVFRVVSRKLPFSRVADFQQGAILRAGIPGDRAQMQDFYDLALDLCHFHSILFVKTKSQDQPRFERRKLYQGTNTGRHGLLGEGGVEAYLSR